MPNYENKRKIGEINLNKEYDMDKEGYLIKGITPHLGRFSTRPASCHSATEVGEVLGSDQPLKSFLPHPSPRIDQPKLVLFHHLMA